MTVILKPFLLGGIIVMEKVRTIYGVGINDADYPVGPKRIGGRRLGGCKIYQAWVNMLQRCYSEKRQTRNPSYIGCYVAPEWLRFSAFRVWMLAQPWQGRQLDKDVLIPGNKCYSPSTCVFICQEVNKLLCDAGSIRGEWPIGVCWAKREQKFLARCCNPANGKFQFLGYFDCPQLAHEAWRRCKHKYALEYAARQEDPRVAAALRARYLPENLHKIGI